jgi:hypothetical protein
MIPTPAEVIGPHLLTDSGKHLHALHTTTASAKEPESITRFTLSQDGL